MPNLKKPSSRKTKAILRSGLTNKKVARKKKPLNNKKRPSIIKTYV